MELMDFGGQTVFSIYTKGGGIAADHVQILFEGDQQFQFGIPHDKRFKPITEGPEYEKVFNLAKQEFAKFLKSGNVTRYISRLVEADAHEIVSVGPVPAPGGSVHLALRNGENVTADAGMIARYFPKPGDYWVIQDDGYVYLNPKAVFERKYRPATVKLDG